ncbi:proline-rich protein 3-like [Cucurbita pepo subsp. pepo]|uniref:proline-rich protein 3-like n=1 Tax=Cucurbita pepo subsp. pepo TaxID=3664 RepID=UPI000C9D34B6|nr:proline-rich protein 3-like [Cucurbita pepo subsp. pepo]
MMASLRAVFLSLLVIVASAGGDDSNGGGYYDLMTPKLANEQRLLSTMIGIQGIILYKSGSTIFPLEGGLARITCKAVDEYGYEAASYTFLSDSSDANGYFLATLSPSEVEDKRELKECKAFLEVSPLENCQAPSDLNNGVSGALLHSYELLVHNKMKLFSVGPFLFTCQS